jgi:hypothetical protein
MSQKKSAVGPVRFYADGVGDVVFISDGGELTPSIRMPAALLRIHLAALRREIATLTRLADLLAAADDDPAA